MIRLARVSRGYPGDPPTWALRECDLSLGEGEFVTVIGPSGSGKSTLLNILGLLDRPTSGTYLFRGKDAGELSERERADLRAREIGFVFQAFHLLDHRSALENVMLAGLYADRGRRERAAAAAAALEAVGLGRRRDQLPGRMSGGERQRVALARAVAHRPPLLLCDEPTGNLDSTNAARVLDLLSGFHRDGTSVVVITHDPAVAARGGRTVRIHDGRVEEGHR